MRSLMKRTFGGRTAHLLMATPAVVLAVVAVAAPVVWSSDADRVVAESMSSPSADHLLGTDALGRDMFQRTIVATRPSLLFALEATLLAVVLATIIGGLSAVAWPRVRRGLLRLIDGLQAFPSILLAIFVTAIVDVGPGSVILAVGIAETPALARVISNLSQAVMSQEYIPAARSSGVGSARVLTHYLLRNIAPPLITVSSFVCAQSLIYVGALSYLGLGTQPPSYDWGTLLATGIPNFYVQPALVLGPAVAITLGGLAISLVGEALAGLANPLAVRIDRTREVLPHA